MNLASCAYSDVHVIQIAQTHRPGPGYDVRERPSLAEEQAAERRAWRPMTRTVSDAAHVATAHAAKVTIAAGPSLTRRGRCTTAAVPMRMTSKGRGWADDQGARPSGCPPLVSYNQLRAPD